MVLMELMADQVVQVVVEVVLLLRVLLAEQQLQVKVMQEEMLQYQAQTIQEVQAVAEQVL